MTKSRKILFIVVAFSWLALLLLDHAADNRLYYEDVANNFSRALLLVDQHHFDWQGSTFFEEYRLGPLAHVLATVPLLFTRDIYAQYIFLSLLALLAVLFFGVAAWRLFNEIFPTAVATMVFAYFVLLVHQPVEPSNPCYYPVFLALYFLCLVEALNKGRLWILATFLAAGLCLQLHMSCALLLPTTIVALRSWQKKSTLAWTVFGLLAALAVNTGTVLQFIVYVPATGGDLNVNWAAILLAYAKLLLFFLLLLPKHLSLGFIFCLFCLSFYPLLRSQGMRYSRLLDAAFFHLIAGFFIYTFLTAVKGGLQVEYFNSVTVFLPVAVGLFFQILDQGPQIHRRLANALLVVLCAGLIISHLLQFGEQEANKHRYSWMTRLNDQVAIGETLAGYLSTYRRPIYLYEEYYEIVDGKPRLRSTGRNGYRSLCIYLQPELRSLFVGKEEHSNSKAEMVVLVSPARLTEKEFYKLLPEQGRILIKPFVAGHLRAALLQLWPITEQHPPAVADRSSDADVQSLRLSGL